MAAGGNARRLRRRSLERAAATYDEAAQLQREVGSRLLERLQLLDLQVDAVCDLGCGTGSITRGLFQRFKGARVVAVDLAQAMLAAARRRAPLLRRLQCACADVARLPLRDASVDLVFSNLVLYWCEDLDAALREMHRVVRPGGALLFSTLGPDTLREWRACWNPPDASGSGPMFADMHDVGDALVRAGFAEPVMDVERLTLEYRDVSRLVDDIRALGERHHALNRRRTLTGKGRLTAAVRSYEQFRRDGVLPATFEVVYGTAWVSSEAAGPAASGAVASVSVDSLRRRLRESTRGRR